MAKEMTLADFYSRLADVWIYDSEGHKLSKYNVYILEQKHSARLEVIADKMCCDYQYKDRQEIDPNWVDPKINQEEYEKEKTEAVIKNKMNSFLREDYLNGILFENKQFMHTLLKFGIRVHESYKEINNEINNKQNDKQGQKSSSY